jgi:hypothetical protein
VQAKKALQVVSGLDWSWIRLCERKDIALPAAQEPYRGASLRLCRPAACAVSGKEIAPALFRGGEQLTEPRRNSRGREQGIRLQTESLFLKVCRPGPEPEFDTDSDLAAKIARHSGQRIRSESIRITWSGEIERPHERQTVFRAPNTFARLILFFCTDELWTFRLCLIWRLSRNSTLDCPLPLQPHPRNQPHPIGEGTTLKPDISSATKTGHFNLLPTNSSTTLTSGRRQNYLHDTPSRC